MNERHSELTRIQHVVLGCCLMAALSTHAQSPQPSAAAPLLATQPHTVALASDSCPDVRSGDKVSLDWNPGFEHPGIVGGLRIFHLGFGRLDSNGVTVQQIPSLRLGGLAASLPVTDTGNGYFHVEFTIPAGVQPGEYHLIKAASEARTLPEYQGPALPMTNSPVSARFCITVVPVAAQQTLQHSQSGG